MIRLEIVDQMQYMVLAPSRVKLSLLLKFWNFIVKQLIVIDAFINNIASQNSSDQ